MKQLISLPGEAGGSDGLDFLATLDPARLRWIGVGAMLVGLIGIKLLAH